MRRLALSFGIALLTFLALALPAAAGGCIATAPLVEGTSTSVKIASCAFNAGVLRVPVGSTVYWINLDSGPEGQYSVVFNTISVRSPVLHSSPSYGSFAHTFTTAGTFPYYCDICIVPGSGTIIVTN